MVLKGMASPASARHVLKWNTGRLAQLHRRTGLHALCDAHSTLSRAKDYQPVANDFAIELGYRYRSPAIAGGDEAPEHQDPRQSHGCPGFRAPHLWLESANGPVSTLDLFGRGFVLLAAHAGQAWAGAAAALAKECPDLRAHIVGSAELGDPKGRIRDRLRHRRRRRVTHSPGWLRRLALYGAGQRRCNGTAPQRAHAAAHAVLEPLVFKLIATDPDVKAAESECGPSTSSRNVIPAQRCVSSAPCRDPTCKRLGGSRPSLALSRDDSFGNALRKPTCAVLRFRLFATGSLAARLTVIGDRFRRGVGHDETDGPLRLLAADARAVPRCARGWKCS